MAGVWLLISIITTASLVFSSVSLRRLTAGPSHTWTWIFRVGLSSVSSGSNGCNFPACPAPRSEPRLLRHFRWRLPLETALLWGGLNRYLFATESQYIASTALNLLSGLQFWVLNFPKHDHRNALQASQSRGVQNLNTLFPLRFYSSVFFQSSMLEFLEYFFWCLPPPSP